MRIERVRVAAVLVLAGAAVWLLQMACGPCFPNRLLLLGDGVLDVLSGQRFGDAIEPLVPKQVGTLIDLPKADYRDVQGDNDDWSALVKAGVVTEEQAKKGELGDAKLPEEFRLYLEGRDRYLAEDLAHARESWQRLLDLPESQRRFRTQRACYMMGRSYVHEDPEKAVAWFRRTREEAARGFDDTLGLPNASLGWEARAEWNRMRMARAIELYMEQRAAGGHLFDPSLEWSAERAMKVDDAGLQELVRSEMARKVMHVYMAARSRYEWPWMSDGAPKDLAQSFVRRWTEALERAGVREVDQAGALAWFAYGSGDFELADRWCRVASQQSPEANWIRSRLLARAGKLDEAAEKLRVMAKSLPDRWYWDEGQCADSDHALRSASKTAMGERGVLLLTARHYTEAMDSFLAGDFWEDAAWVGERVLSIEELEKYVQAKIAAARNDDRESVESLAWMLARRLARNGRCMDAMAYAPVTIRAQLATLDRCARAAADTSSSRAARAAALWEAARLMRAQGLEITGTEFAPDFFVYQGNYAREDRDALYAAKNGQGVLAPSADERARTSAAAPQPDVRFHYRFRACELAWQAAELMPDGDAATAQVLCEAGRWVAARDAKYADKFYKSLVRRCGQTELGKRAASLKWFPPAEPKTS